MGFISIITSLFIGIVISLQGNINNQISKNFSVALMILSVSLVQSVIVLLKCLNNFQIIGRIFLQWQVWIAAILGVFIMTGVVKSISTLGTLTSFSCIIVGQVTFSAIIDTLGLLGQEKRMLTMPRLASIVLMVLAVLLLLRDIKTDS